MRRTPRRSLGTCEAITANPDQVDPHDRREGEKIRDGCSDASMEQLEMLRVKSNQRNARDVDRDDSGACRETPPEIRQGRPAGEGLGKKSPPQYRE